MARKGNPISVRLDLNRSSDPSRFFSKWLIFFFSNEKKVHSVSFPIHVFILVLDLFRTFCSLPIIKLLPLKEQTVLFWITRCLFFLLLSRAFLSMGYLLMDELSKAVLPFYPSSGGVGSNGQPPLPSPSDHPFNLAVSQDPEGNRPGGSHTPLHHPEEELRSRNLCRRIEDNLLQHCERYCNSIQVRDKYPELDSPDIDYRDLAKQIANRELNCDTKLPQDQLKELEKQTRRYREMTRVIESFLWEKYAMNKGFDGNSGSKKRRI